MIRSTVSFLHGTRFRPVHLIACSAACLAATGFTVGALAAPTLTVLYGFKGKPDGLAPNSRLTKDSSGAFYGTTYAGGVKNWGAVFKLTPPAGSQTQWSSTILYSFTDGSDGKDPVGGVILDSSGALYGTTYGGGGGTVFKLTPPAAGKTQWTYSLLHSFAASNDGKNPWGRLIMIKGELYGTTYSGGGGHSIGTVYKLTPPAAGKTVWTETVLHRFDHAGDGTFPSAGLITDGSGALYGTTDSGGSSGCVSSGCGMVFKLTPPGAGKTAWTETVLYSFKNGMDGSHPLADLSLDSKGVLYGTTSTGGGSSATGCGTVFKLTPPAAGSTQWTETVLYRFKGKSTDGCYPHAGVVLESTGALYGTTSQGMIGGTVFKLTPPAGGLTQWTEAVLYNFKNKADGYDPEAGLILDNGTLYGTTYQGSSVGGVVFKLR